MESLKDDLISCKLIAANANTTLKCCDYNSTHKALAFGSSNLIHIYDVSICKTHLTLNHHSDRVNSLKWFQNPKSPNDLIELISVGADGKIVHWANTSKNKALFDFKGWKMEKEYQSSDKAKSVSINIVETLYLSSIEKYFAVFTSNGVLDLFYFDIDLNEFKMFTSLVFNTNLQDTLCLTVLNDSYLLLLTGGYDSVINVHTVMRLNKINSMRQLSQSELFQTCLFKIAVQGHTNAIRGIASICPFTFDTDQTYIASCSQDHYIRTWHITKLDIKDKGITDKMNLKGTISIFDEYKSKTSYVINVDGANKQEEYYNITLDSVLSGHENSISSIQWGKIEDSLVLLSASFDFSVVIWKYDSKYVRIPFID